MSVRLFCMVKTQFHDANICLIFENVCKQFKALTTNFTDFACAPVAIFSTPGKICMVAVRKGLGPL